MRQKIGIYPLVQIDALGQEPQHMTLVWEEERIHRLALLDQRVEESGRMAEMHILVEHAVDEEELATNRTHVRQHTTLPVALGVGGWRLQVALGVRRIIAREVSHRRPCHGHLEDVRRLIL